MLIDLKSLNKAEQNTKEPENQPVLFLSVPECRNLADPETSLRKQIGILEHNVCINFWSYGSFSLHELMFYILQQTGPAHINMCTWSISQDAIEKIIRKYQKGEILSIRFLLDPRVKVCKAKPLQMLSATFSHKILRVHAKVVTIENEVWKISVVSSQNATTNPKLERGVIFISDEIFNFDKTVFEHEFNTARTGNNRETGRTVLHPTPPRRPSTPWPPATTAAPSGWAGTGRRRRRGTESCPGCGTPSLPPAASAPTWA